MLPSDMTLKIRPGTVRYNNKILVSDEKFILGKNQKVNLMVPVMKSHKTNSLETPAMKSTQTAARSKRNSNDVLSHAPAISQKNQEHKTIFIESDGTDPIKYYSTSAAAKHCGVTKQTLDYTHRNRCTRIVRRKGGVKEFRITWL